MSPGQRQLFQAQESRVAVRCTNNALQSLVSGTAAAVAFQIEDFDTHGMHDNVTNNGRLTCIVPGLYIVGGAVTFTANVTGARVAFIATNGITVIRSSVLVPACIGGTETILSLSTIVRLVAGDYVQLGATQFSGGALNIRIHDATAYTTEFWATRLGS